jgi:hypothetical protein
MDNDLSHDLIPLELGKEMRERIGLIGATAPKFFQDEFRRIFDKYGYAWYGWTIPLRRRTLPILKRQIDEVGHFNLYGYSSSWPERGYARATHRIEVTFVIKKYPVSHWDTGREANPCPQPEKGIQGYEDYYIVDHEHGHGKYGNIILPRKTWFAVADTQDRSIELSEENFTSWNPKHKIHPSALRANFIEIVDSF